MMKVISFSNQKGGVGKTTTTAAMAAVLKNKGFRVLAIDLDPQGNLTFCMGGDIEFGPTIYDVFKGDVKAQFAIQRTNVVDVIASSILLSGIELEFTGNGREYMLKSIIKKLENFYDFVLIDTPPALSILTINAFTASDCIIVPMGSDIFSLQGLSQLNETVEYIKKYSNERLKIAGILLTRFNERTHLSNEVRGTATMIANDLGIHLFEKFIRSSVSVTESQSLQKNLLKYAPTNNAVYDYIAFVDEFLEREGI